MLPQSTYQYYYTMLLTSAGVAQHRGQSLDIDYICTLHTYIITLTSTGG